MLNVIGFILFALFAIAWAGTLVALLYLAYHSTIEAVSFKHDGPSRRLKVRKGFRTFVAFWPFGLLVSFVALGFGLLRKAVGH